ncbi:GTP:adenosylcobinamide-phosphate guanylyltransferase [Altererythrobacter atlanticus]|uniref:MobA-like NTP transferase domain protein n=1 Tax=Croceibacterium atlanticum TaxID=1267766 RepID=A0A0F7KR89_9SPHN|nr:NTP transferase domain-containing protein [Croceibacterium atlanticum]AKH41702.1 MobA-like NTP transferase domain protein [Croceibacterium atlanticum]MBB5733166.1 GTP:adenosylcobinamide-phosphate guanylyltransferase [Croceibacterium atlanticum]
MPQGTTTGADQAPVTLIILAGQRFGVMNPLAKRAGVSHKCLVPICGKPLISYVLETATRIPEVSRIRVSLEPDAHGDVQDIVADFANRGIPIDLVANKPNIVDSVADAAGEGDGPFIVTTADNVLLTREAVAEVIAAMQDADAVICLAGKDRVRAAHPEGQRGFYEFKDNGYANCNLYGLANRKAFTAAEFFREGGQFMKNPGRLVRAVGLVNILLMRFKLIGIHGAMRRLGKRFGLAVHAVIFEDGALAIDVDNERTYNVCEELLRKRKPDEIVPNS